MDEDEDFEQFLDNLAFFVYWSDAWRLDLLLTDGPTDGRVLEQLEGNKALMSSYFFWHIETAFWVACYLALVYDLMNEFHSQITRTSLPSVQGCDMYCATHQQGELATDPDV